MDKLDPVPPGHHRRVIADDRFCARANADEIALPVRDEDQIGRIVENLLIDHLLRVTRSGRLDAAGINDRTTRYIRHDRSLPQPRQSLSDHITEWTKPRTQPAEKLSYFRVAMPLLAGGARLWSCALQRVRQFDLGCHGA